MNILSIVYIHNYRAMYILLLQKKLEQGEHIMNGQNLLSPKKVKDDDLIFEDKNLVKISRSKLGYFSAITLPMILAACGGGGGGGGPHP